MTAQVRKQKHWHELTKSGASIPSQKQQFLFPDGELNSAELTEIEDAVRQLHSKEPAKEQESLNLIGNMIQPKAKTRNSELSNSK